MKLDDVKIGDKFLVRYNHWHKWKVEECTSVTPKQCVIGNFKFRKSDAECIGGKADIMEFSQSFYNEQLLNQQREWVKRLDYRDFKDLPNEKLDAIYQILRGEK